MTKKFSILILSAVIFIAGCKKDSLPGGPKGPQLPEQINFSEHDLFPEGLAYDPTHNWFFVSSAAFGTVGVVTADGTWNPVVTDDKLTSTTGLKVDKVHHRLWVCNVEGGIGAYDLNNGQRIFYTDLSMLLPGEPLFMNDEVIDPDGNAYVTSSAAPVIFKVSKNGSASVFFKDNAFAVNPDEFGFNGIQYNSSGYLLVAHTALNQIIKIPINNPSNYKAVQLGAGLSFPDGMLLSKDGKQLVVVSDDKVLSFISKDQWESASLSTSFSTGPVFATSLTSDGKRVYVVYCHLDKLLSGQDQDDYTIQEVPLKNPDKF
ncbi:MAG: SMP-30/gluconolactonase/LRE family protein [Bacteroidetes bacterium]|nr:SMP-30/gluconolactonase/LRE family protein [Bacteroidota bacterium]MBS1931063.1 SMP-30/gluconolactonase/LRE family protein [Bacteroidota bacterium]